MKTSLQAGAVPRHLLAPVCKRLSPCCWSPLSFPLSEIPPTSGQKTPVPLLTPTQPLVLHPNARWHTRLGQELCQAPLPFSPPFDLQIRDGEPALPGCRLPGLLQLPWSSAPASPVFNPSCGGIDGRGAGTTPAQGGPGMRGRVLRLSPVPSAQALLELASNA